MEVDPVEAEVWRGVDVAMAERGFSFRGFCCYRRVYAERCSRVDLHVRFGASPVTGEQALALWFASFGVVQTDLWSDASTAPDAVWSEAAMRRLLTRAAALMQERSLRVSRTAHALLGDFK